MGEEIGIVRPINIVAEMRSSYLDYAMSVIVSRALPDVRDGLKPVQRRILYAMLLEGLRHDQRYSKCAGIVGEVLKKYHPHGDSAVYDALVRLAQPWNMRYPLVDGQGNFGCFTGDTQIKLTDGTERTFAELAALDPQEIFQVYAVDAQGHAVCGEGRYARITRRDATLVTLTFDDGSVVRCTPDHRFMLHDGEWKQAQYLTSDDRLKAGRVPPVLQPTIAEPELVRQRAGAYAEAHPINRAPNHHDIPALSVPDAVVLQDRRVVQIRWLEERCDVYDITVDEHHNFMLANGCVVHNSIDGDPPAAYRYTEARLTEIAEELLVDIDKNTIDYRPNFDGEHKEPKILPALLPNLLLNGASGIAVGMATNIPPHNLNEICDAIVYLVDHPDAGVEELMERVPGPDFPTGASILGTEGVQSAYSTGRGRITLRAKAHIEEGSRSSFLIVVTELPYQVNKARLHERIAEMAKDRKIEGIRDIQDQSDRTGMRLVIFLKQDAQPKKVLNALYKHSQMQSTFGCNMLALTEDGTQPRVLTLRRMLKAYIEHRQEVIRRRTEFDLEKARARAHILEGLKIALDNIDEIIRIIRGASTVEVARTTLITRFSFSDIQAQAILDMQLRRLAALERKKIEDEYNDLLKLIAELEGILADPAKVLALIKQDIAHLKEKYGDERRTRIIPNVDGEVSDEDLVPDIRVLITLTQRGSIKRQSADTFRTQRRGGRGVRGVVTREQDVVRHLVNCSTMDSLLFFTDRGKVYQLKAHEVPDASRTAKGLALVNLVSLEPGEMVTSMLAVPDFDEGEFLVMATRRGKIKRTLLQEYSQVRSNGLIAIGLEEGDELGWVTMSHGHEDVVMTTASGRTIRFKQEDVRPMGRPASGVIGVNLSNGDRVVDMALTREDADLLVVTERGFGKRTALSEYPRKGRATSGVITIKLRTDDDRVAGAMVISGNSLLTFITTSGTVMRTQANYISRFGRGTQGVTIVNLNNDDRVAAIACEEPVSDLDLQDGADADGESEVIINPNGAE